MRHPPTRCYAMSGTEIAHAGPQTGDNALVLAKNTDKVSPYALSGTRIGRYAARVSVYAPAMRCPVLT
eukprot:2273910-Rhodomonas_salina.1